MISDHPFGSYYHWCALLCGLSEAALEHGLLSTVQLDAIRADLEATLPGLRACRQLLVVIPASLEQQPRVVELLRDEATLGRLRRVHELAERLVTDFASHVYFPAELELLCVAAGFEIAQQYGDYRFVTRDRTSQCVITVARRPRHSTRCPLRWPVRHNT